MIFDHSWTGDVLKLVTKSYGSVRVHGIIGFFKTRLVASKFNLVEHVMNNARCRCNVKPSAAVCLKPGVVVGPYVRFMQSWAVVAEAFGLVDFFCCVIT